MKKFLTILFDVFVYLLMFLFPIVVFFSSVLQGKPLEVSLDVYAGFTCGWMASFIMLTIYFLLPKVDNFTSFFRKYRQRKQTNIN